MEVVDNEHIAKNKETLNEDQLCAFEGLVEFLNPAGDSLELYKSNMITIVGYAGTGKTYMISRLVDITKGNVAMTAPTNKAVKVLAENTIEGVEYLTIHKLLGLRMKWIRPKPGQAFEPYQKLVKIWKQDSQLGMIDLLIVDEVSMLDDELFLLLLETNRNTKIIFLGDPAQIPPVGKDDAIPLVAGQREKYNIELFALKKVMRQADGSGILRVATSVRDNRFGGKWDDAIKDRTPADDVFFDTPDSKDFLIDMVRDFTSQKFERDPNFAKLIAYRNVTVDKFNEIIRTQIYRTRDLKFIMKGEKLIAHKPVIKRTDYGSDILFNTSDEFEVVEYEEKTETHYPNRDNSASGKNEMLMEDLMGEVTAMPSVGRERTLLFRYLKTKVVVPSSGREELIDILLPESESAVKEAINKAFKKKDFETYEELRERFATVSYNYAITCHKAQGSTYENVYVIEDDIDRNKNILERNRIKYTAVSRASKKLRILSRRN